MGQIHKILLTKVTTLAQNGNRRTGTFKVSSSFELLLRERGERTFPEKGRTRKWTSFLLELFEGRVSTGVELDGWMLPHWIYLECSHHSVAENVSQWRCMPLTHMQVGEYGIVVGHPYTTRSPCKVVTCEITFRADSSTVDSGGNIQWD